MSARDGMSEVTAVLAPHWRCNTEQDTTVLWGGLPQTPGGLLLRAVLSRRAYAVQ